MRQILACYFTNIPIAREPPQLELTKKYNPADYPKYDNYDAINVDRVKDIPFDYDGAIGVPITFLNFYTPGQWEILGIANGHTYKIGPSKRYINPIQHVNTGTKKASKANTQANIAGGADGCYYTADNCQYPLKGKYSRILIRRKRK